MIEIQHLNVVDYGPGKAKFNVKLTVLIPDGDYEPTEGTIVLKSLKLMFNKNQKQCSRVDGMWVAEPSSNGRTAKHFSDKELIKHVELSSSIKEDIAELAVQEYHRVKPQKISPS